MKNNLEHMTIYTTIFNIHSAYTNHNWAKPNLSNQTHGLSPLSLILKPLTEAYPFSSPSTVAGNSFPHNDRPRLSKRNLPSLSSQPSLSFHPNRITKKRRSKKWVFFLKFLFGSSFLQKTHNLMFFYSFLRL